MAVNYVREKDFNQLDWNTLLKGEFCTNGKTKDGSSFSFGKGGNGYPGGDGHMLTVLSKDGEDETVYELPTILSDFIDWSCRQAQENKINEIKGILHIP